MAYTVFLSHSGKDRAWVEWIAAHAQSVGVEVYLYEHDVRPGFPIAAKVQESITAADALVVLLTENSRASAYVQQEIGFAEARSKPILALVQPGIPRDALAMLEGREYVEFDFHEPETGLQRLLQHLQKRKALKDQQRAAMFVVGGLVLAAILAAQK